MGQLKHKSKVTKEFKKEALFKPAQVNDTRFGIRRIFLNQREKPTTFSYSDPNTNWWGTR
jgi:hypothetical protein